MPRVTEEYDEYIVCRDMLRNEEIILPHPGIPGALSRTILFGHICDEGVMMLNYITSIPASKRLQRRISETIQREFELFCMQKKSADIDEFLLREAALVRHTIHVLSSRAQLDVLPQRALPPQIDRPAAERDRWSEELTVLRAVSEKLGFSRYAQELMGNLFRDYAHIVGRHAEKPEVLTAVIFLFADINSIDLTHIEELYRVFGSNKKSVNAAITRIRETIGCVSFDPRYLGEEGFVTMLYSVVDRKSRDHRS